MRNSILISVFISFISISNAQVISIPDQIFKQKLLEASELNMIALDSNGSSITIDTNNDGEIQIQEALTVYNLTVECMECNSSNNIQNLMGINSFANLRSLTVGYTAIPNLNLSNLTHLIDIICNYNSSLTTVELIGMNSLKSLNLTDNAIESVNFNEVTSIRDILCSNNNFTEVHLNGLPNLEQVYFGFNQITSFTITNCPQLFLLWCNDNLISELQVNHLLGLTSLYCQDNLLTSIDVTQLSALDNFFFSGNNLLTQVFMKNGSYQTIDNSVNLNNINYVCADEFEIEAIQTIFNSNNYTNYYVSYYCSFTPGGQYYVVSGNSIFDNNSNGCDVADFLWPNLNINITDGTNSGMFIANATGQYAIPVYQGTHILTPVLENPTYFNIVPSSLQVTFPTETSPYIQNFCITPNGIHKDLEVSIIPLSVARPGFDSTYRIVYKNKGNVSQTGTVTLTYEDDYMDLVSSIPATNSLSFGLLSWDYVNLLPFETKTIEVKMNVNSPMETPPVIIGDQLDFAVTINPLTGDEFLGDNIKSLKQIVVGSYDPNDKTCLEGNVVGPEMIGAYVYYVIRFENTGTFMAENVVIKDMIDLTKFELTSLIPISASHSYTTRIANDGKVEFIFENIQLPFDDANNDGYIAFKIKTKPTLAIGDIFTNYASIYFDYNFPIVTNTASTVIQVLGISDFEFSNYFSLFPNPANEILNIKAKQLVELKSIYFYNALGQLVLVIPNANHVESIDISDLKSGNYFVKLVSDIGTTATKFVKK